MIMMDDPEHSRLRKIVSRAFTPARSSGCAPTSASGRGESSPGPPPGSGDFVRQVACELPLQAIAGLLGVPLEDYDKLFDWSNKMIGSDDPEFADNDALTSAGELMWYAMQLAAHKTEEPGDDIVTALVQADAEGQRLSEAEFGMFVVTLAIAGNETTRNSITQGMMAFTDYPDQWELFKAERPRPRPTRSSAGPPRSRRFSAPPRKTPSSAVSRSARASGWCCSTARPISMKRSSMTRIVRHPA